MRHLPARWPRRDFTGRGWPPPRRLTHGVQSANRLRERRLNQPYPEVQPAFRICALRINTAPDRNLVLCVLNNLRSAICENGACGVVLPRRWGQGVARLRCPAVAHSVVPATDPLLEAKVVALVDLVRLYSPRRKTRSCSVSLEKSQIQALTVRCGPCRWEGVSCSRHWRSPPVKSWPGSGRGRV